jgi:hypothetical protein
VRDEDRDRLGTIKSPKRQYFGQACLLPARSPVGTSWPLARFATTPSRNMALMLVKAAGSPFSPSDTGGRPMERGAWSGG